MNLRDELRILQEIQNATSTKTFKLILKDATISNFKELEDYALKNELSEEDLSDLIYKTIGAFPSPNQNVNNALKQAREFLINWPVNNGKERPFFMEDLLHVPED